MYRSWSRRNADVSIFVYISVVDVFSCPSSFCTSSIRAPRFRRLVANVCRKMCGVSLLSSRALSPNSPIIFSYWLFCTGRYGFRSVTINAGLSSTLFRRYFCNDNIARAFRNAVLYLLPLPNSSAVPCAKSTSERFNPTNSDTRHPVLYMVSTIAASRSSLHASRTSSSSMSDSGWRGRSVFYVVAWGF